MHVLRQNSQHNISRLYLCKAARQISPTPSCQSTVPKRKSHDWISSASIHNLSYKSSKHHFHLPRSRVLLSVPSRYLVQSARFATTPSPLASPEPPAPHVTEPSPITIDQFHRLSDAYIDTLVAHLEEMQERREEVDVEYSAGVLTLLLPPAGTFVLNKQPPNKQIWLSSPISGPKRYDWVETAGEGETGKWTYLRDGSTLNALLAEEVGISMEDT